MKKADGFREPEMLLKAMAVLEQHHFRLPILRFVFDLFDKKLMRRIVLDDSDESEVEEDDERGKSPEPVRDAGREPGRF